MMKTGEKYQQEFLIFLLTSLLIMVYLIIRAVYVPFTHDEASTFFRYVQPGKLIPGIAREDANNHFLNTVLTWVSLKIFGNAKWTLRLPNLLFAPVYFYFLYRIGVLLKDKILRYGFWITLLFSLYFIEFLAVSRGYGMSMALFMGVLYYLIKTAQTGHPKYYFSTSLFVLLMLSANLNLIIPAVAMFVYQFLLIGLNHRTIKKKQWFWVLAYLLIYGAAFYFSLNHLLQLRANSGLYIGGNNDFIHGTLFTLTWLLTGKSMLSGVILTLVFFAVILAINLTKLIRVDGHLFYSPGFMVSVILFASLTGILLAARLFGVHYPEDRLAMYLFPLLTVSLFFTMDEIQMKKYRQYAYILLLPFLFFPVHFFTHINIWYVNGYRNEAIPQRFYDRVHKAHIESGVLPTIGGSNMRQFAWMYIDFINGGKENMVDWKGYPDTVSDFQILEKNNYLYPLNNYQLTDSALYSGLYLYKRKKPVLLKRTKLHLYSDKPLQADKKYQTLLEINSDTISGKYFFFDFRMNLYSEKNPFHAWLVIHVSDQEKQTLVYKYIPFGWLKYHYDGTKDNFHQSMFVGPFPENASQLKIYIWNMDEMKYELKEYEVEVFEVK